MTRRKHSEADKTFVAKFLIISSSVDEVFQSSLKRFSRQHAHRLRPVYAVRAERSQMCGLTNDRVNGRASIYSLFHSGFLHPKGSRVAPLRMRFVSIHCWAPSLSVAPTSLPVRPSLPPRPLPWQRLLRPVLAPATPSRCPG